MIHAVNLNPGGPNGGSAGQYFVGEFDGVTFRSETTVTEGDQDPARLTEYHWLDWGRDYYAAVSFSNVPDGRRLRMAWMNNWQYGNDIPTSPWRSPMSLVREVSLVTSEGAPHLTQQAVIDPAALTTVRSELGLRHRHPHQSPLWVVQATSNSSLSEVACTTSQFRAIRPKSNPDGLPIPEHLIG